LVSLKIGPLNVSVSWEDCEATEWPHPFYIPFTTEAVPDLRLHVHFQEDLPSYPLEDRLFEAQDNRWNLYRYPDGYVLETYDTAFGQKNRVALMNHDWTCGRVFVRPEPTRGGKRTAAQCVTRRAWSLPILLRQLGELLVVNLLSRNRGLLVHALGINDRGTGLLFVGRSGSGKTTLANLYQGQCGVTILSDERMIISLVGSEFVISGTPWPGGAMLASADSLPLRRIFFLEHARTNVLCPEKPATLAGLLFQQLFLPFWDRQCLAFTLRFADELLQTVPVHRLGFVNDSTVIEFIREQVSSVPCPAR